MLETVRAPDAGKNQRDEAGRQEQTSRLGAFISGLSVEYGWEATATTMPVTLHFHGFGNFGSGSLYVGTPLSVETLGECRAKADAGADAGCVLYLRAGLALLLSSAHI